MASPRLISAGFAFITALATQLGMEAAPEWAKPYMLTAAVVLYVMGVGLGLYWLWLQRSKFPRLRLVWPTTEGGDRGPTSTAAPAARHYSTADRDLVSDALRDLRQTLSKRVKPLNLKVQDIHGRWLRRAGNNRDVEAGAIEATHNELRELRNEAVSLRASIFDRWVAAHSGFEELFRGVVGKEAQTPLGTLASHIDRLSPALVALEAVHQRDIGASTPLNVVVERVMIPLAETTNQVNNWINTTHRRIDEVEKTVLGGR